MGIKNIETLNQFVQLPEGVESLKSLIESEEEHEISISEDIKVFKKEEHEQYTARLKDDFETAGREKLLKKLRDDNGLEYDGVKDPANFLSNFKSKVVAEALAEAKIEPEKRIEALNKDLEDLRGKLGEKDEETKKLQDQLTQVSANYQKNEFIRGNLPTKSILEEKEMLTLINSATDIRFHDGGFVVYENGEIKKDDLAKPVDAGVYIKEFSSKWSKSGKGGAGGSDKVPGKSSLDHFNSEMEEKGFNVGSESYMKEYSQRIKDGTLIL